MRVSVARAVSFVTALVVASSASGADLDPIGRAKLLRASGALREAASVLAPFIKAHPADVDARLLLADIEVDGAHYDKALEALAPVALKFPGDTALLSRLAAIYRATKRSQSLAPVLATLARRPDAPAELLLELAATWEETGNPREQAAALDQYLVKQPTDVARWEQVAGLRERFGHVYDLTTIYGALAALVPSEPSYQIRRGDAWAALERDPEALQAYEAAAKVTDNDALTWKLITCHQRLGNEPAARALLQRMASRAGDNNEPRERLARLLGDEGRFDDASDVLAQAVRVEPTRVALGLQLARYQAAAGHLDAAIATSEDVLSYSPGEQDTLHLLAEIYPAREQYFESDAIAQMFLASGYGSPFDGDDDASVAAGLVHAEVAPSLKLDYRFLEDSTGQSVHGATLQFAHTPLAWLRYRLEYGYAYHIGPSRTERDGERVVQGHGGLAGLDFTLAPRSTLSVDANLIGYQDIGVFIGARVGFRQTARLGGDRPLDFRLWIAREAEQTTLDAFVYETVKYVAGTSIDLEPVNRWLLSASASYGRYLHTDWLDGARLSNNGLAWTVATGVRAVDDPLTLDIEVDYTGQWFQLTNDDPANRIPYFAPTLYQTVGLPITLTHTPHWRVEYQVFARPAWVLEDEALQVSYGANLMVRMSPLHKLQVQYQRTDTPVGEATRVFQENSLTFSYTGAF